jgi:soluble P-type ATPase
LTCRACTVNHKQRKYYRIIAKGGDLLEQMRNKIKELYEELIKQP